MNAFHGASPTALIAAVVSAVVSAGAAVATTQTFVLGTTNRVNAPSKVTNVQSNGTTVNSVDAPLLSLENKSTTANATPLSLLPVVWVQAVDAGPHTVELQCRGATYLYVDTAAMSVSAHLYEG